MFLLRELADFTSNFVFFYPFIMSLFWMAGAVLFFVYREREEEICFDDYDWPMVSFLVPCFNEEDTIEETIRYLSKMPYPKKEIIAVNDGSTDQTAKILYKLAEQIKELRFIDCKENCGKANSLHIACHAARAEYLICIDADAILDPNAPFYLIHHFFKNGERVGAVTGNPRVRNRKTLLSKLQIVEYASIIGSIKRTQRILGKVMTVSGVVVAFRKKALADVGLWDRDMITEDIAVSWKLQRRFWDIRYEPRALCWMLVPETLKGIWKQRIRWAQGGEEVLIRHWRVFCDWRQRRIWIVYLEQLCSILWTFSWLALTVFKQIISVTLTEHLMWFTLSSFVLVLMSFVQLLTSVIIDSKHDSVKRYLAWSAWYPALYWIVSTMVVIFALPRAIRARIKGGYALWSSPDRGMDKTV
ncbi:poly-beta-1,6-N-acetyl-D-glucosamine synthase [Sporolactobacillus sp. CQH2019]|uniref:poly-beta-1,6-N-acetyl-D-glucosamine synthase n=2 Tax=unclassified Sporolactobacillus TaxID=2628533 RepID=UPI002367BBA7|nr:poly-beta-1,6-N-acetyl-D-glucosamine synthase [Sporolactobacillus sp. CQH2019]MDD9150802.1 poly-beta-1,6-N-acetyl-D-glucosamine synthase [Sporolactobacillus sp. CQH2019]